MELLRRNCTCNLGQGYTCTCPTDALEARVAACEARLATWTPPAAPAAPDGPFKPLRGEYFWWVSATGALHQAVWGYDSPSDRANLVRGNVFRTESEAKKADQRSVVTEKLRALSDYTGQSTWYEVRYFSNKQWIPLMGSCFAPNAIQFSSPQSAEAAIKVLGTELDVLLP